MSYAIDVENGGNYVLNPSQLREAAVAVLEDHTVSPGSSLTIAIEGNDMVRMLNRQFRGVDAPTDVLSFPADLPPMPDGTALPYLGDLVIAYPYATDQANRLGHDLDQTLKLLVVHGTLHLLGFDHDTRENRQAMWAAQAAVLEKVGVPLAMVPALEEGDDESSG